MLKCGPGPSAHVNAHSLWHVRTQFVMLSPFNIDMEGFNATPSVMTLSSPIDSFCLQMELAMAGEAMEDSGSLPSDPEALQSVIDSGDEDIRELERKMEEHRAKEEKYKVHSLKWSSSYSGSSL